MLSSSASESASLSFFPASSYMLFNCSRIALPPFWFSMYHQSIIEFALIPDHKAFARAIADTSGIK
jgi:hypothetical protein